MDNVQKSAKEKKPIYKKVWFWIIIIIVIAGFGAATMPKDTGKKVDDNSNSNSNSQTEQTTFKVGDKISFDSKIVIVKSMERNWSSGNQYSTPDSGNEYVKVEIHIENDSKDEISYNTFDWKIQDSNGKIVDADSTTYSVDGALGSGQLAAGGKVSGFLVFQASSGDSDLTLRYEPSFWSDKKLEIKLQ
jgi:flagellar hook assembly protein FlgD